MCDTVTARLLFLLLVTFALGVEAVPRPHQHAPSSLREVRFENVGVTSARGVRPRWICEQGCKQTPSVVRCIKHVGTWRCESDLQSDYKLGSYRVSCPDYVPKLDNNVQAKFCTVRFKVVARRPLHFWHWSRWWWRLLAVVVIAAVVWYCLRRRPTGEGTTPLVGQRSETAS